MLTLLRTDRQASVGGGCQTKQTSSKRSWKSKNSPNIQVEEVNLPKRKKNNQAKFVGLFGEDISLASLNFLNKNNPAAGGSKGPSVCAPSPSLISNGDNGKGADKAPLHSSPSPNSINPIESENASLKKKNSSRGDLTSRTVKGGALSGLDQENSLRFDASRDVIHGSITQANNNPSPRDSTRNVKGLGVDLSTQSRQGESNDSVMEWTSVQSKRGKRGAGVSTSPKISVNSKNNVETRNRFASIATEEAGEVFSPVDPREGIRKNPNKIPNIYLDNVKNWASLYKNIKTNCAFPPVARLAGRRTVVKCQTIADFFFVKDTLSQQKIDFFTYRLASEKKRLFVIRDLPINLGVEEIKESLEEQGVQTSKITQLQTTKPSFKQLELNRDLKSVPPRALPLFLVELHDCTPSVDFLADIIEKHRPPKGPPQCHRCQLFDHTDKACYMPPRCVKCGGNHLTADCKKDDGEAAVCANCNPASYRGCPVYSKLKQRLNDLKNKAQSKIKKNRKSARAYNKRK
ncbi:hypothetical protein J437_LFUL019568 [Ladona fulva]|nr:hypothetical protein J437_LFUL019568 [Ladona fulva]